MGQDWPSSRQATPAGIRLTRPPDRAQEGLITNGVSHLQTIYISRYINTKKYIFLGLQSSYDSSTLGGVTSLRGEESRMMTVEFITALFYEVDEQLRTIPKHPEAHL